MSRPACNYRKSIGYQLWLSFVQLPGVVALWIWKEEKLHVHIASGVADYMQLLTYREA
jgi:hypothetical protein